MGCNHSNLVVVDGVTIEQWKEQRWYDMVYNGLPNGGGLITAQQLFNFDVTYAYPMISEGKPAYLPEELF